MLWKRVLTAIVLIPLLLLALFRLPAAGIAGLFGLVVALSAWELAPMIPVAGRAGRIIYTGIVVMLGGIASVAVLSGEPGTELLFAVASAWWLYATVHVGFGRDPLGGRVFGVPSGRMLAGVVILVPAWIGFLYLHRYDPDSPRLLIYLLMLIWVADSAAYFGGHAFGRRKLAPRVSPGKTIEGALTGLLGSTVVAALAGVYVWTLTGPVLWLWILLGAVTMMVSVTGDLTESVFKRIAGVKDSGHLLPGHGGMFDRIDALTAAAPVFSLGWYLLRGAGQ